jgi:hypothetical protein
VSEESRRLAELAEMASARGDPAPAGIAWGWDYPQPQPFEVLTGTVFGRRLVMVQPGRPSPDDLGPEPPLYVFDAEGARRLAEALVRAAESAERSGDHGPAG